MTTSDFALFCHWQLASGDVDPAYPLLRSVIRMRHLDDDEAHAFVLLYVAYYDLASALSVWPWHGGPVSEPLSVLPTGTERRNLRGGINLNRHLTSITEAAALAGGWRAWLTDGFTSDPAANWTLLQSRLREPYGNGRWAAYKTGEVLKTVLGYPLAPTDAGHDFSTGPRHGLGLFYPGVDGNGPQAIATLNKQTEALRNLLGAEFGVGMPVEQLETMLCDWHTTVDGRYYIGHDIDLNLGQLNKAVMERLHMHDYELLMLARAESFEPRWLGEVGGWSGVRPALRTLYRDHGRLEWWT